YSQLTTLNNQISRVQLDYQKAKSLIANRQEIEKTAQEYKSFLQTKSSGGDDSLSQILSLLEALARKNDIALSDIKPSQSVKQTQSYLVYTVDLGLNGNPEQVMRFVADLQEAEFLFEVERANLTPIEDALQLKMKLSTAVFK
ncbi:MAG: type 4a pilus biogenesis protein PilO, partial [Candidatus Omnitrophota bacterium]